MHASSDKKRAMFAPGAGRKFFSTRWKKKRNLFVEEVSSASPIEIAIPVGQP